MIERHFDIVLQWSVRLANYEKEIFVMRLGRTLHIVSLDLSVKDYDILNK